MYHTVYDNFVCNSTINTLIKSVVLYECETWSLTLRKEHRLRVFENRVLRRLFGPKREEVIREWKNYIMRSFMICTAHPIMFR